MTTMANLRLYLPELVLASLAVVWAAGFTSDVVAAFGIFGICFAAGISIEEMVYRYHRRQGRHGHRFS